MDFDFPDYVGETDETKFIIGLDLGDNMSSVSFFNFNTQKPEQIDLSGGYGKAGVPTVVQYINDSNEWVFGEYALLNKPLSNSVTFQNIIANLGKNAVYNIGGENRTHSFILSLFIKYILEAVNNINPNAEIIGIVISVSVRMTEQAEKEFRDAVLMSGYNKVFIGLINSEQALMYKFLCDLGDEFIKKSESESILLLDFGSSEIRAVVYELSYNHDKINLISVLQTFNESLGIRAVEKSLSETFSEYFKEETQIFEISESDKKNLEVFTYQHKDVIFKNKNPNGIKLYFNFCYPPFKKSVTNSEIESIINIYKEKFVSFLKNICDNNLSIHRIICGGGGFEMLWALSGVKAFFPNSSVTVYKNPKGVISEGACLIASNTLGLFKGIDFFVADKFSIGYDIGFIVSESKEKKKFFTVVEKNSFEKQTENRRKVFLKGDGEKNIVIEFFKRSDSGEIFIAEKKELSTNVGRKGFINCFEIIFKYSDKSSVDVTVEDLGFGNFFPKTGEIYKFNIKL